MKEETKTFDELFDEIFTTALQGSLVYNSEEKGVVAIGVKQFFKDYLDKELERKDLHCHEVINDMVAEHKKEMEAVYSANDILLEQILVTQENEIRLEKVIEDLERECVGRDIKKVTHGTCCTCQYCGHDYDDCRCEDIGQRFIEALNKRKI